MRSRSAINTLVCTASREAVELSKRRWCFIALVPNDLIWHTKEVLARLRKNPAKLHSINAAEERVRLKLSLTIAAVSPALTMCGCFDRGHRDLKSTILSSSR
jgi:hypothetical protein